MEEVERQWRGWPPNRWKIEAWHEIRARLVGKVSTPWSPSGGVHDFMHAKVVVADGEVLTGSYNLSHGGEENAENLLHIEGGPWSERFGAFVDRVVQRYRDVGSSAGTGERAPR
jgi:phosphatidylserine/phosphatidylglycerophosphate/cardiolipin synthase-like enzyme